MRASLKVTSTVGLFTRQITRQPSVVVNVLVLINVVALHRTRGIYLDR